MLGYSLTCDVYLSYYSLNSFFFFKCIFYLIFFFCVVFPYISFMSNSARALAHYTRLAYAWLDISLTSSSCIFSIYRSFSNFRFWCGRWLFVTGISGAGESRVTQPSLYTACTHSERLKYVCDCSRAENILSRTKIYSGYIPQWI